MEFYDPRGCLNLTDIKISTARTEKSCNHCPKTIKPKEVFIRIGNFPTDRTFHLEHVDLLVDELSADLKKLKQIKQQHFY